MLLNFFRRVNENRHILKKDNPAAGDIMPEQTPGRKLIHMFKGNNCKVHEKPYEEYKMERKHFDPGWSASILTQGLSELIAIPQTQLHSLREWESNLIL